MDEEKISWSGPLRERDRLQAVPRPERLCASLMQGIPIGRQVPVQGRLRAPVPLGREQGLCQTARGPDPISARHRQEFQPADRQRDLPHGRQAPGLTPGLAIREAARLLAVREMRAAAPVLRALVPVPAVSLVREHELRLIAPQQDPIPAVQRQEREAAGRQREHSQERQAHGRGQTREHGPARVGPAAESRGPARIRAPIPAGEDRHTDQRAAGAARGEGNAAPSA